MRGLLPDDSILSKEYEARSLAGKVRTGEVPI